MARSKDIVGTCWYCGGHNLTLTDEHVLSEKNFGGRLVSRDAVCEPCNSTVGRLERQIAGRPPLAEYVARHSHLYARKPSTPRAHGLMASGFDAHVAYRAGGVQPIHVFADGGVVPPNDRVVETRVGIGEATFDEWPRWVRRLRSRWRV